MANLSDNGRLPQVERERCVLAERYATDAMRCMKLASGPGKAHERVIWLCTAADLYEQAGIVAPFPEIKENYLLLALDLLLESGIPVRRH